MFIIYTWGTKSYWEQQHYSLDNLEKIVKMSVNIEYIITDKSNPTLICRSCGGYRHDNNRQV